MLESDDRNPDSALSVEFFVNSMPPNVGVPFVRISKPGDKLNIVEQKVKDVHKARFPQKWLHFQAQHSGAEIIGTTLTKWSQDRPDDINHYQVAELTALKFQTVEQVALMSDNQVQMVGMSGPALRIKARAYVNGRNVTAHADELAETKKALAELQAQMAELMKATKRGPGRPPKEQEAEAA